MPCWPLSLPPPVVPTLPSRLRRSSSSNAAESPLRHQTPILISVCRQIHQTKACVQQQVQTANLSIQLMCSIYAEPQHKLF